MAGTDDSTDMSETDASDDNDADAADMSSDDSSSDGMNDPSDTEGADDWSAVAGLHRLPRPSGRRYICRSFAGGEVQPVGLGSGQSGLTVGHAF